jgi:hypothetical protein
VLVRLISLNNDVVNWDETVYLELMQASSEMSRLLERLCTEPEDFISVIILFSLPLILARNYRFRAPRCIVSEIS